LLVTVVTDMKKTARITEAELSKEDIQEPRRILRGKEK
jgi:hypothetical protein